MQKTKILMKNRLTIALSFLLIVACTVYFGFAKTSAADTAVRTVAATETRLDTTKAVEENYDSHTLEESKTQIDFSGTRSFSEKDLLILDNMSLADIPEEDVVDTIFSCSFNMEAMEFNYTVEFMGLEGDILYSESDTTPAIVTETGSLDAVIEIAGETYMLSDYMTEEAINDCFFWLFRIVAVIVAVIVVLETAEQIKGRQNYEYNKQLEANGNGVNFNNYITDQSEDNRVGYNSANYRFGFTTFSDVGCEVASVYNLLISLNKAERLSETIRNFELWCIEFAIALGNLGSNPEEIGRYLNHRNISYTKIGSPIYLGLVTGGLHYQSFKDAVNARPTCKIIMSRWNKGVMTDPLHTFYIDKVIVEKEIYDIYGNKAKVNVTEFRGYNYEYKDSFEIEDSIDDFTAGNFIVGYII